MNKILLKAKEIFNLTDLEIEIINVLLQEKQSLTAKNLTNRLSNRGKNFYRPLERLVQLGLIEEINVWPKKYSAYNFNFKIENSAKKKISELQKFVSNIASPEDVVFLGNRTEYRNRGEKQLQKTERTVDLIVSGTMQDSRFFFKHFEMIQKGVQIRCLVTKYDQKKADMFQQWIRNGFLLRKITLEGINVIIYDSRIIQVAIKKSVNRKEKFGFSIENQYLGEFFQQYFNILWEKGAEI